MNRKPTKDMHKKLGKKLLEAKSLLMDMLAYYSNDTSMYKDIYRILDGIEEARRALGDRVMKDWLIRKNDLRQKQELDKIYFPIRPE